MPHHSRSLVLLAGLLAAPTVVSGQEVTLSTEDQTVSISGTLSAFDGSTYTLETVVGQLVFEVGLVTCTGAACPEIAPPVAEFAILHDLDLPSEMITTLLGDYAATLGGTSDGSEGDGSGPVYTVTDGEGDDLARVTVRPVPTSEALASSLAEDGAIA
ncbi:MAG: hypothetical protein AAF264_06620, partial [Pseudomonadota bacterium]